MRQLPLFPVTVVGSLPRPPSLVEAMILARQGRLAPAELETRVQSAVEAAIRLQEECGVDVVSDGEQARPDFYSFIAERVDGVELLGLKDLAGHVEDRPLFERLLADLDIPLSSVRVPVVVAPLRRRDSLAVRELRRAQRLTDRPIKVALPGPYLLTRSAWVQALSSLRYPDQEALGRDVVALLRQELEDLGQAGCAFVQFDEPMLADVAFAEPEARGNRLRAALSRQVDPDSELTFAVDLINRVVEGFEGLRTGLHVCRGHCAPQDKIHLRGSYNRLLPYFAQMNIRQFVLEYASEQEDNLEALARLPADREIGLGVLNPRTAEMEPVETVISKTRRLARAIGPERIFLNPDCGFEAFANRPVNTTTGAAAKLRVLTLAAARLRRSFADP
jgi:5-methyltetrahydropteroyltriglutamate--homocysteine methyltransferase